MSQESIIRSLDSLERNPDVVVQCHVCRLGPDLRAAVDRAILRGVTQKDISVVAGVSVDSIRKHSKNHLNRKAIS